MGSGSDDYTLHGPVAVDGSGNVYVSGFSGATWGSPVNSHAGGYDAFAAKLDSSGGLLWHTFMGSASYDESFSVAVDGFGNVYVAGYSDAAWGSPVNSHAGGEDVLVAKIIQPWYVTELGSGAKDGTSWDDAFDSIQDAIDAASPGGEIWVKEGTYALTSQINVIKPVAIYGGFPASMLDPGWGDRDWENNVTIVDGQDLVRCFSVVTAATIDGFTITRGNGGSVAGGMWLSGPATITNCTFSSNSASSRGGAIYSDYTSATISNCTFTGNSAINDRGGAIYYDGGSDLITNSTFTANSAESGGAIAHAWIASPTITNSIFSGNVASVNGGAIHSMNCSSGSPTIANSTFFGNSAGTFGGAIYNENCSTVVTNSILWGDGASVGQEIYDFNVISPTITVSSSDVDGGYPDGTDIIDADPLFVDAASGDFHLDASSPLIDAGDDAAIPAGITTDFDGEPRISYVAVDIGADEYLDTDEDGDPDVTDPDDDNDGLLDSVETNTGVFEDVNDAGTDPKNPDSDGDGLNDGDEVNTYLTDPNNPHSDGDGLTDGDEVITYGTDPLTDFTAGGDIYDAERAALIDLYNDTNGAGWSTSTNWSGFVLGTECTWYGVNCDGTNNVIRLILNSNLLDGEIPASLGNLASLEGLWLQWNDLYGPIPPALENLTSLRGLYLAGNQLGDDGSGIPLELGSLTELRAINLGQNELKGPIPSELGDLNNLNSLELSYNQLSGPIPPELGNLANLTDLYLNNNQLSGGIPDLSTLTGLQTLDLSWNPLGGTIPDLSTLTSLRTLNLGFNQLTLGIPDLSALIGLQHLDLSVNQLTLGIPDLSTLTSLQHLDLRGNPLGGTIPNLSTLTSLQYLNLGGNQLTGSIPDLSALTSLQHLNLAGNQLSGSIPDLSALTGLQHLYLQNNQRALTGLQQLSLYNNDLSGSIPDLSALTSLRYLYLHWNHLTGSIPDLSALTGLQILHLGWNQLTGSIPDLSALTSLEVSGNQITGPIPTALKNLPLVLNGSDFRWSALYVSEPADPDLIAFLTYVQSGNDWESTQTIAPTGLDATVVSTTSVELTWTPVAYGDGYEVHHGTIPGGPYSTDIVPGGITANAFSVTVPIGTDYYFVVTTVTNPHAFNQNTVHSESNLTTTAR
jgi:predicted outer membrane repeat protein